MAKKEPTEPKIRQRKRKVELNDLSLDTVIDAEFAEVDEVKELRPGPQANHPPLPRNEDDEPMPVPPPHRLRVMCEQDFEAFKEFLFHALTAMIIAQRGRDDMARTFAVTYEKLDAWLRWLKEEKRRRWMSRDQMDVAAEQEAHYRRAVGYAWQQAGSTSDTHARNRWVNTALRAEAQLADLYREARVYRTLPVRRAYDEGDSANDTSVRALGEETVSFMKKIKETMPRRLPKPEDDIATPSEGLD